MLLEIGIGWAARAAAQGLPGEDRGIGGTGVAPSDPAERLGQDRGIGGTGVVGTIRRFGSIVVNDLQITYPPSVRVTIDDRAGHDARSPARPCRGGLGPSAAWKTGDDRDRGPQRGCGSGRIHRRGRLQGSGSAGRSGAWQASTSRHIGEIVAVSGLRRPDGSVVASLVEPRPGAASRLRGPLRADENGDLTIGISAHRGAGTEFWPAAACRWLARRTTRCSNPRPSWSNPGALRAEADRLSIEAYVAASSDGLSLGSGLV